MSDEKNILEEFYPFADIGSPAPKISSKDGKTVVRMVRETRPLKVQIENVSGKVSTSWGAAPTRYHASIEAMFSSEVFANMRRWADAQRDYLASNAIPIDKLIPINGETDNGTKVQDIDDMEPLLAPCGERGQGSTHVLLIDGPAGIGKTNVIEQLAYLRARNYRTNSRPLLLHVKSRGRVLSNLQDLMAFSLQSTRSTVTYDQVPVLVRRGLVIIAIDGFDELGDPNGYELAWAQLGELIAYVRGKGTLVLAGRDTFIGKSRLLRDVPALRPAVDSVVAVTLGTPTALQATTWLKSNGWSDANFSVPAIQSLLEDSSYALRPVFLRILQEHVKPKEIREKTDTYLTSLLTNMMIARESKVFGSPVEAALSVTGIEKFLNVYLRDIAREMADSQTDALDVSTLSWIAEASLGDGVAAEIVSLVKNRAAVVAFLMKDERPSYMRFIHSQLANYFLSSVAAEAIMNGDTPKFVRRNLIGSDLLMVFIDVVGEIAGNSPEKISKFVTAALRALRSSYPLDRTRRNLGALLLAALPSISQQESLTIGGFEADETVIRGTAPPSAITNVTISQLDARNADLSAVRFEETVVISLIASESTRFSSSFPTPTRIWLSDGVNLEDAGSIEDWLARHGRAENAPANVHDSDIFRLLDRACRARQYWLRTDHDVQSSKILNDRAWGILSSILGQHGFLRREERQASGQRSTFFHIKQREDLLAKKDR